jgi:hypothetical protein
MSRVFVDTLANLALLVATDAAHPAANRAFARLAACEAAHLTTSWVLVETYGARIRLVESPLRSNHPEGFKRPNSTLPQPSRRSSQRRPSWKARPLAREQVCE